MDSHCKECGTIYGEKCQCNEKKAHICDAGCTGCDECGTAPKAETKRPFDPPICRHNIPTTQACAECARGRQVA